MIAFFRTYNLIQKNTGCPSIITLSVLIFPSSIQKGNVFPKIIIFFSRRTKVPIRIPITVYIFQTIKKMQKRGDRWRKMAEIVCSICLVDKAEDIVLDLFMIKVLQAENIS
ncbi:uncharacterized protein LOC108087053 [Drosophila ficusphila]|uniref:uncharacterized protein LOC108087053 n=1 Tax=Drosophila ficusphila TaxID=30025 RepID=UPI0007E8544F|nr:uncharacterized protein LOC108087053 [Drosophila ficusphila]